VITADHVLARRLLAALEQAAAVDLPSPWKKLSIGKGKRRSAAAVLLGLADRSNREDMLGALKMYRLRAAERAKQRGRSADEDPKETEELKLWNDLDGAIHFVSARRPGGAEADVASGDDPVPLRQLAVWERLGANFDRVCQPFRDSGPLDAPAPNELLDEIARILLRAKARTWMDEDRAGRKSAAQETPA
jgi:hypothetical protein